MQTVEGLAQATVVLRPRKARPFYARHPWVLDSAIARVEGEAADGDVVDLVGDDRRFIARGIINRHSRIRVRLYTWDAEEPLDEAFFRRRLSHALRLRTHIGYDDPTGAARLVFSEADGLSGLIVDRFAGHVVMQITALAMAARVEMLAQAIDEMAQPHSIALRIDAETAKNEGLRLEPGVLRGELPENPIAVLEHGIAYEVDPLAGQKTGFYLDQRENRAAAARYLRDRRVLDLFCYTGGFALTASKLGAAKEVLAIDGSQRAIERGTRQAAAAGITNVTFQQEDAFAALDRLRAEGAKFDAVILDPPKFARNRQTVNDALRAYHRINRVAVDLLEPEGILVTCSCSGSVLREDFQQMLAGVAEKSGRTIQILENRGASPDHPLSPNCPENEYLKCFICRVV